MNNDYKISKYNRQTKQEKKKTKNKHVDYTKGTKAKQIARLNLDWSYLSVLKKKK